MGNKVKVLLAASQAIDRANDTLAVVANFCVLVACLISAGNAVSRYLFSQSSNSWLEVQWYLFAAIVMLGAPHTLRMNEHVRVDLLYNLASDRVKLLIDVGGILLFLFPACILLTALSWPWFVDSWNLNEESSNFGGLVRWPVKLLLPVGFALMVIQGLSELIKRLTALRRNDTSHLVKYEKPLQ